MISHDSHTLAEATLLLRPGVEAKEAERVAKKIQNQVSAGLIHPIRKQHSGRGVHRRFDSHELLKISVFLELEQFYLPNTVLLLISNLFDNINPNRSSSLTRDSSSRKLIKQGMRRLISDARNGEQDVLLMINSDQSQGLQANLYPANKFDPAWRSSVLLNLTKIFEFMR